MARPSAKQVIASVLGRVDDPKALDLSGAVLKALTVHRFFVGLQAWKDRTKAQLAAETRARAQADAAIARVHDAHPEHEGRCVRCVQWCTCMDDAAATDPELRDLEALGLRWTECPHGNEPYPCPTVRALDGIDLLETERG
ncbi:hypothetical protein ACGFNP_25500 [Nonomuraea sp. NPDC049269]|uniref:hypothetical protein n=1 Tax=Nonomuraea sp. NPDC049269 TaxID=3364349 RepID=UPI0037187700